MFADRGGRGGYGGDRGGGFRGRGSFRGGDRGGFGGGGGGGGFGGGGYKMGGRSVEDGLLSSSLIIRPEEGVVGSEMATSSTSNGLFRTFFLLFFLNLNMIFTGLKLHCGIKM